MAERPLPTEDEVRDKFMLVMAPLRVVDGAGFPADPPAVF
jgi:hypothetical protein